MKPILIIQNHPVEGPGLIGEALNKLGREFVCLKSFELPDYPEVESLSAAIVLGTPISVRQYREHEHLVKVFEFMSRAVNHDLPLLGLCFGGQMLAHVLGARVERNEVKEIGVKRVTLTEAGQADPLFEDFDPEFPVFEWHGDTFKIPFGASHLAASEDCANQSFRLSNAVALQFHIEAPADEIPLWCDEYASELEEEGLNKTDIVTEVNRRADEFERLTHKLIANFLR